MVKIDIFSHNVDPAVTVEYLDGLPAGVLFPRIRGVATACYAHKLFPKLPLQKAVTKYIEEEEKDLSSDSEHIPCSVEEFVRYYDGVRCVSWGDDREGRMVCTIGERGTTYPGPHPWNLVIDLDFTVSSVAQAKKVARTVLRMARRFSPIPSRKSLPRAAKKERAAVETDDGRKVGPITGMHFSGNVIFVSCDV